MKKTKNNNGFSMVELLAVIVILGLLSAFAIVSISAILNRAEKNHYKTQEKEIEMAAKSYTADNKNALPKNIGDKRVITLTELQQRKYIGKILDRSKNECTGGQVTIFKYSQSDYSYKVELVCPKYDSTEVSNGEDGPNIKLDINTNYNNSSFTYEVEAQDSDKKIIGYSYSIYKHGVLVSDSGTRSASRVGKIDSKTISLREFVPGSFEIVFKATDIYGSTSSKKVSGEIVAKNAPTCGETNPTYTTDNWRRYTEAQVVNIKCIDNDSGCARDTFSQSFNFDTGINYIEIVNNAGIKNSCPVGVYIDNTKPSTPVITNPYENTWINKSYTVSIETVDETSGIKEIQYRYPASNDPTEREWKAYPNSSKAPGDTSAFTSTPFSKERSEYVEVRSCDYAGNCSDVSKSMIKIDKTPPNVNLTKSGTMGPGGFYVTVVTISIDPKDDASGVAEYGVSTLSTPTYNNKLTAFQSTVPNGIIWYGYVKDNAGNVAVEQTEKFKVIADPPKVTFSLSGETSTATCADGFTGETIQIDQKTLSESSLIHSFTCTNVYGQSTTASHTYKVSKEYHCTSSRQVCDKCHGRYWCGSGCPPPNDRCYPIYCESTYDCNCRDECNGGYYEYTYSY